jgi:hypothetical protein
MSVEKHVCVFAGAKLEKERCKPLFSVLRLLKKSRRAIRLYVDLISGLITEKKYLRPIYFDQSPN